MVACDQSYGNAAVFYNNDYEDNDDDSVGKMMMAIVI